MRTGQLYRGVVLEGPDVDDQYLIHYYFFKLNQRNLVNVINIKKDDIGDSIRKSRARAIVYKTPNPSLYDERYFYCVDGPCDSCQKYFKDLAGHLPVCEFRHEQLLDNLRTSSPESERDFTNFMQRELAEGGLFSDSNLESSIVGMSTGDLLNYLHETSYHDSFYEEMLVEHRLYQLQQNRMNESNLDFEDLNDLY